MSDNNSSRIAKNTLFLYFRMACVMLVTLYTSRVVLDNLGINDFGVYQTVGGIVGLLSFINSALSTGTSRFLTYELGTGNIDKLKRTFSTLLIVHIFLAAVLVLIGDPAGTWFIINELTISEKQLEAVLWVYQLSLMTGVMSITQVPYNAVIIAHEQFKIFAYLSVLETFLKLLVAYLIIVIPGDKLVNYAVMICAVQIIVMSVYRWYCVKSYTESKFKSSLFDKVILRDVLGFSGWSMFAASSIALQNHGTIILLNNFFSPAIVTSRTIAVQVTTAVQRLIQNFQTAANPQIVKRYAAGDFEGSKRLLLKSAKGSYYLMLMMSLPVILLAHPLLQFWLGKVPEYAAEFLQWSMVQCLFCIFDTTFYYALYAKGQLRENALISPIIGFFIVPIEYMMFNMGYSPMIVAYLMVVVYAILGLIVKPILIHRIVNYSYSDIRNVFYKCGIVTLCAVPVPIYTSQYIDIYSISGFIFVCIISTICVLISSAYLGLNQDERKMIKEMMLKKLRKC